jgi:hypothetical protein
MHLLRLFLVSCVLLPVWAQASPRQLALEQFPTEVRELVGKPWPEARKVASGVAENKRREDDRGLMLNLLGVNYDVTLGKKNEAVDWMALRSPEKHAKGLYEKVIGKYGTLAETKRVVVGDPAPGRYVDLIFPGDRVQFRFVASSKALFSVVVQRKP